MILTCGDDQVHIWGQVLKQEGEGLVYRFGIYQVVVVQDEKEFLQDGGDFIQQDGEANRSQVYFEISLSNKDVVDWR